MLLFTALRDVVAREEVDTTSQMAPGDPAVAAHIPTVDGGRLAAVNKGLVTQKSQTRDS